MRQEREKPGDRCPTVRNLVAECVDRRHTAERNRERERKATTASTEEMHDGSSASNGTEDARANARGLANELLMGSSSCTSTITGAYRRTRGRQRHTVCRADEHTGHLWRDISGRIRALCVQAEGARLMLLRPARRERKRAGMPARSAGAANVLPLLSRPEQQREHLLTGLISSSQSVGLRSDRSASEIPAGSHTPLLFRRL